MSVYVFNKMFAINLISTHLTKKDVNKLYIDFIIKELQFFTTKITTQWGLEIFFLRIKMFILQCIIQLISSGIYDKTRTLEVFCSVGRTILALHPAPIATNITNWD